MAKPQENPLKRRRCIRGGARRPKDEKPLNQGELAAAIGYTRTAVSQGESGARRMSDGLCEALARFYNVDMETIREEADMVWERAQRKRKK